jgi:hypothetical protein
MRPKGVNAMTVAQGINKTVAYKKQSGLGVAASGAGGTCFAASPATSTRPRTATRTTRSSRISSPPARPTASPSRAARSTALLSGTSWMPFIGSLLRKDPAATAAITVAVADHRGVGLELHDHARPALPDRRRQGRRRDPAFGRIAEPNNVAKNCVVVTVTHRNGDDR